MRYPTLSRSKCAELAEKLRAGNRVSIEPHVRWHGTGEDLELAPIETLARQIMADLAERPDQDPEEFEGAASIELFKALQHVPVEILDDRGFWRCLSLQYFWDYIAWREAEPFAAGNHLKYVDASLNAEAVLPRMYLRACAVGGHRLAAEIRRGVDFWRSHVIRVRIGSAPPIARAFVEKQAQERFATGDIRVAAKHLNRLWANVVLYVYDDQSAKHLIDSIWHEHRSRAVAAGH